MSEYEYVSVHANDLDNTLRGLSERRAEIVAVSQSGNVYTIFCRCSTGAGCVPVSDLFDEDGGEILQGGENG